LKDPNALIFLNRECNHDSIIMKQAAELGSIEALRLLAKTNHLV